MHGTRGLADPGGGARGQEPFAGLPASDRPRPDDPPGWRTQDFDAVRQDPAALQARLARLLPAVHGPAGPLHSTQDSDYRFDHLPVRPVAPEATGSLGHSASAGAMRYHELDLAGQQIIVTEVAPEAKRPEGLRTPSLQQITACLERLPLELAGYLRFVVLHSQSLPAAPGRRAEAAARQTTIHFFPTDDACLQRLQGTLIHEGTHLLQDHLWAAQPAGGRARMAAWKGAMRRDPHPTTAYAGEHVDEAGAREDCAEMAVMYFALKDTPWEPYLREAYPNRFEAFGQLLAAARDDLQRRYSGAA